MREFLLIYRTRLRTIGNTMAHVGVLQLLSFIFVITLFFLGAFYVLYRIFGYLTTVEVIGYSLIDRTLEMAFFVFFIMLLFSNIITSFSTFYNSRELEFLFSLPVPPTSIYLAKLFENSLYASWATMILALPLVVAYGRALRVPTLFYPVAVVSVFVYLVIPAALASVLIFILLTLFPRLKPRGVIIVSLLFIIGLSFLYLKFNNPGVLKIFETENEQDLINFAANLSTVGGVYVPSTWLANIIKGFRTLSGAGFFYFLLLTFASGSAVIVAFFIARLLYHHSWLRLGEHSRRAGRLRSPLSTPGLGPARTLLFKDILIFVREPTQWVQLSIFLILLVIYVFSLSRTPMYFVFPQWRTVITFANFSYICFVLATLGVRFIYPAVSLEHDGLWILGSSPLPLGKVIRIKYFFNLVLVIMIFEGLLVISNLLIRTDPTFYLIMPVIGLFVAASLVAINLGLGSRFPHFNEDNPSRIAAGSGGIIAALVSVAYVGVSLIILAAPGYNYLTSRYLNRPGNPVLIWAGFAMFLVFNLATIFGFLRLGVRSLERKDL
jgi:ABC-2 type transport system permease protein